MLTFTGVTTSESIVNLLCLYRKGSSSYKVWKLAENTMNLFAGSSHYYPFLDCNKGI